jgi:hypothetical protein
MSDELEIVARLDGGNGGAVSERRLLGNREPIAATD